MVVIVVECYSSGCGGKLVVEMVVGGLHIVRL